MKKAEQILKNMTFEEKIGQLIQLHTNCFCSTDADLTGPDKELGLSMEQVNSCGSVFNFNDASEMITAQKEFMSRGDHQIPLLFMENVVHGHKTIYPVPLAMGGSFNPELLEECCRMAAKESAASGVHVTFAPMLDLVRDARWGRVMESTGEDPYLNCVMAESFVKGFQGNMDSPDNVAVCVKHFAAYGCPEGGRDYNTVDMSERNLREYYLPAYKAAIDAGAEMVMTSFNTIDGVPVTGSKKLLNQILREEFGFDKILISDYASISQMIDHGYCADEKECALRALECNVDIEMMSPTYAKYARELIDEGKLTMEHIDRMVMRVLVLKEKMGLFDNPYTSASTEKENEIFLCKEHRDIARRAVEESAVLLKNDGMLPLSKNEKIALIGPFADNGEILGAWLDVGRPEDTVTLYQGMKKHAGNKLDMTKACGYEIYDTDESGFAEAIEKMKAADKVVLAIGEYQRYSGEGRSRGRLDLPILHIRLAEIARELGKDVTAVVFAGRPLELEKLCKLCNAVIYAWQPGTEGGSGLANILYGDVNPSGKLAMCMPYFVGQMPLYYNYLSTGRPKDKGDALPEDMAYMPYTSMYGDLQNLPLFPFGYGLSYTSFEIGTPVLSDNTMTDDSKITVSVNVKNTGAVAGKEVVQMYIQDKFASVVRPVRELKGFEKIFLEPGEEKTVTFEIEEKMLRFYNQDMEYVSESGEFAVYVGNCSDCEMPCTFYLIK